LPEQESQHKLLSQQDSQPKLPPQEPERELPKTQPVQYQQTVNHPISNSGATSDPPPVTGFATSNPANSTFVPPENLQTHAHSETNRTDTDHKFSDELPPSKLLNSVTGEPSKGQALRRLDSQTHIEDEFHDAIS
jgi:hypothetical protein